MISLFFMVKFSLTKLLQLGDEFFVSFFLLIRAFFTCFILKRAIVFFELFLIHLQDGTIQYLLVIHSHVFHLKYPWLFFSKFWLGMLSGIPVILMLLRRPYCPYCSAHFQCLKFCFQGHLLFIWDVRFLLQGFW